MYQTATCVHCTIHQLFLPPEVPTTLTVLPLEITNTAIIIKFYQPVITPFLLPSDCWPTYLTEKPRKREKRHRGGCNVTEARMGRRRRRRRKIRRKRWRRKRRRKRRRRWPLRPGRGRPATSRWGTGKRRPLRRDQGCKVTLMTQSPAAASGDI